MVSGYWTNQDGLPLQYGTLKAQPEMGGDYLIYGETREIETYVCLVPTQWGSGGIQVPAIPTGAFVGTGTPIQAGIQSMTTMFPLQTTVVNTGGTTITFLAPQIFLEEVDVETIIGATGGTSISMGLVANTSGTSSAFVQVAPNAGLQILNALPIASFTTAGQRATFNAAGSAAGFQWAAAAPTTTAGGGQWMGNVPLTTTTATGVAGTALANQAFLSTYATGTFTNGLIKVRIRYTIYGDINY